MLHSRNQLRWYVLLMILMILKVCVIDDSEGNNQSHNDSQKCPKPPKQFSFCGAGYKFSGSHSLGSALLDHTFDHVFKVDILLRCPCEHIPPLFVFAGCTWPGLGVAVGDLFSHHCSIFFKQLVSHVLID